MLGLFRPYKYTRLMGKVFSLGTAFTEKMTRALSLLLIFNNLSQKTVLIIAVVCQQGSQIAVSKATNCQLIIITVVILTCSFFVYSLYNGK